MPTLIDYNGITLDSINQSNYKSYSNIIFNTSPSPKCSNKYHFISSKDIIELIQNSTEMRLVEIYVPYTNNPYSKHSFTFSADDSRSINIGSYGGKVIPSITIFNSADKTYKFSINLSLYTLTVIYKSGNYHRYEQKIFTNDKLNLTTSTKHIYITDKIIRDSVLQISNKISNLHNIISKWNSILLNDIDIDNLIDHAIISRYNNNNIIIDKNDIYQKASSRNMWDVYNTILDRIIQGGFRPLNKRKNRATRITNIFTKYDINISMWLYAQFLVSQKEQELVIKS